jgi:hypothetical protein
VKYATKHAAPAAHAATTHAAAPAVDYGAEFRMLLAAPAAPSNPFAAALATARAEADARPSDRAREMSDGLQFTGETRVDARGRRQWLVVCGQCGDPSCYYSRWVPD